MSHYIYTTEAIPNEKLMGKPSYTPEYIAAHGVQLAPLPAKQWVKLPDSWTNMVHKSWTDKAGTRERVFIDDIVKAITSRFNLRGVILIDHEPSAAEKKDFERQSEEANLAFRMKAVEWYENQVREKEVTGQGRTTPTAYENECYEVLGLTKPYSVEAMRAQRHPGEAVGEQIVAALDRLEKRRLQQPAAPVAK